MGITIHIEGKLLSDASYERVISQAELFAKGNSWSYKMISPEIRTLQRVKDDKDWDYTGGTKGIEIQPHPSADPLNFEFDENLYIQEYCKTQFAPTDIHILVVEFIREIQKEFETLEIVDEGEYWDTNDLDVLVGHVTKCNEFFEKMLNDKPNAQGPVRLANGRIVDYMS